MNRRIAVLGADMDRREWVRGFNELHALAWAGSDQFETIFEREDIEGVVVATSAETQHGIARRAMEAGKDVLLGSLKALIDEQGAELEGVARRTGRILMVGHVLEYHPAIRKLQELTMSGTLGRVCYAYWDGPDLRGSDRLWTEAGEVAVILRLFRESPMEVTKVGGESGAKTGLKAVTSFRFKNGGRAHIFAGSVETHMERRLTVCGESKSCRFDAGPATGKLFLYNNQDNQTWQEDDPVPVDVEAADPLLKACEHFLECGLSRTPPLTDAWSGSDISRVLRAGDESALKSGVPILVQGRPTRDALKIDQHGCLETEGKAP